MAQELATAIEEFHKCTDGWGKIAKLSSSFVCPYPDCRAYALHDWGAMIDIRRVRGSTSFTGNTVAGAVIHTALCEACQRDVIFLDGKMVKPASSDAPPPAEDMPAEILSEYEEAALILTQSPRGAAALLRLAVQKLLPLLGAKKKDINHQIAELVANQTISPRVQGALDTLRVIGNEAVHPGTIDLNDDANMAMGLFRLLNFIVEKAISEPKHADEMFALLPQGKKDAIAARDAPRAKSAGPADSSSPPDGDSSPETKA